MKRETIIERFKDLVITLSGEEVEDIISLINEKCYVKTLQGEWVFKEVHK